MAEMEDTPFCFSYGNPDPTTSPPSKLSILSNLSDMPIMLKILPVEEAKHNFLIDDYHISELTNNENDEGMRRLTVVYRTNVQTDKPLCEAYKKYLLSSWRKHIISRLYFNIPKDSLGSIHANICKVPNTSPPVGNNTTKWLLTQIGRPYVYILRDYLFDILCMTPKYESFKNELGHWVIVTISGLKYGATFASKYKVAKAQAAKKTLTMLIPAMKNIDDLGISQKQNMRK